MGFFSNVVKAIYKPIDIAITTFAHPIQVAKAIVSPTKTVAQVVAQTNAQPKGKQIANVVLAGVGYGTALAAGASIAAKGVIAAAKTIIPTSLKGKVVAAVSAPVIIGAVAQAPTKALNVVSSAPSNLANFGYNVVYVAQEPTLENVKKVFTENPVIASLAVAIPAALAAKTIIPAVTGLRNTDAINDQTQAIEDYNKSTTPTVVTPFMPPAGTGTPQPITIVNQLPPSPAVVAPSMAAPAGSSTIKKPKKKRKKKAKKKAKKKTRRSKKKRKAIKRRKTKR